MQMSEKPSYLGLLNAITIGETRGGELFSAWAAATPDTAVREVLQLVAVREREHGAAFAKRLHELGYSVREKPSERFATDLACARSTAPDCEKFETLLKYHQPPADRDALAGLFSDTSIDPQTGELLGRFIVEERDSEQRLRACYAAVRGQQVRGPAAGQDSPLAQLADRLDRLTSTLEEIKAMRATR
jgi:rubrerythrin